MKKRYTGIYILPGMVWLTLFFVVPTLIIFVYSFLKKGLYGGVEPYFSGAAYQALFHPAFLHVVLVTLYISVVSTLITLLLAIPTAYFIARNRYKNILLLLIIIPFWTNFLIRIFAWISILGNNGFINQALLSLGLIRDHVQMLYNQTAVILITVYTNLPYAILPLYSTIEKFDFSLLEAARDLGATKPQSFLKIFIPNIQVGIMTAVIFTFIPTLGSYAVPQLVGGTDSYMIGNIITRELTVNRNWPLASSMSVLLTLITTAGILLYLRMNRKKDREIVRQRIKVAETYIHEKA